MNNPIDVTESSKMSDLLSAASLLLTVLGIVYGAWYMEIVNSLELAIPDHIEDRGAVRRTVSSALYGKAVPLASAALILMAVFLPDALAIGVGALSSFNGVGVSALRRYSAVEAAFCLVVALAGGLAAYLFYFVFRLKAKLREIMAP